MNNLLYNGYERLLQGLGLSLAISFAASLVRVALYGWHGLRDYCASLCVGCFTAICAGWLLNLYDLPMTVNAVIIGLSGICGKDLLSFLLSRRAMADVASAIRQRLSWEILHRGRCPSRPGDMK